MPDLVASGDRGKGRLTAAAENGRMDKAIGSEYEVSLHQKINLTDARRGGDATPHQLISRFLIPVACCVVPCERPDRQTRDFYPCLVFPGSTTSSSCKARLNTADACHVFMAISDARLYAPPPWAPHSPSSLYISFQVSATSKPSADQQLHEGPPAGMGLAIIALFRCRRWA